MIRSPAVPLVIVPDLTAATRVAADLESRGWKAVQGFAVPDAPWNLLPQKLLCVGVVQNGADAAGALLAASRGAGLVVATEAESALREQFVDDLRRLGEIEYRAPSHAPDLLEPEERRLLELLAEGLSLKQAARSLYISTRTADRRLASARRALGAASTSEAITRIVAEAQRKEM